MYGGIDRWCAGALAAALVAAGLSAVSAQENPVADPAHLAAAPPEQFLAARGAAPADPSADDLAKRVAALEQALKKAQDKEAADKKKAAGKPTATAGGMLQWDTAFFNQNAQSVQQLGDIQNGTVFRRARLWVLGEAFDVVDYKLEMDFANAVGFDATVPYSATGQQVAFKDVYVGLHDLAIIGNLRAGHFKEPFGLEELTSDRFITFLERSLSDDGAIVPGRNVGIMAFDWTESERATWALGTFVTRMPDTPPIFNSDNGGWAVTGRATWLPWYDEASEGRGLLHTGIGYSYRDTADGKIDMRARPESYLAPVVINAGSLGDVSSFSLYNAEGALVYGPFSIQAEYFGTEVNRGAQHADVHFNGAYVYASYFLTGEHRPYNRKMGCFDRVRPYENFFRVRDESGCVQTGRGAWEVAYRYSYLDLADSLTASGNGTCSDHTLALNWYLNPFTRLMLNYVLSDVDRFGANNTFRPDGLIHTFQTRVAIDF